MRIIKPSVEILTPLDDRTVLQWIEMCGRTCYKSEGLITPDSCYTFTRGIIERGHESVLEHVCVTVRFICDRGVSHEIVRHRIASYSQESTRYCNYAKDKFDGEITVIEPCYLVNDTTGYNIWKQAMEDAELAYFSLLNWGCSPQEARSVLPNSLKTEVVMTANMREWRHFFKMRCSPAAHPQMQEVAIPLLEQFRERVPVLFDDIDGGEE